MSWSKDDPAGIPTVRWVLHAPTVLGSLTTLVGVLVLNGWLFDIAILKSLHPSFVSMKSNTAIGLTLLGIALTMLGAFPRQRFSRTTAGSASLLAALLGAASLMQYVFSLDFGLDQLLFHEAAGVTETFVPGRMALITCICFTLSGAALHIIAADYQRLKRLPDLFSVATAMVSIFVLLGYAFDETALRQMGSLGSMAIHTALGFLIIAAGALTLAPSERITAPIFQRTPVGLMLRWVLPAAVLIPVSVGWLRLVGERAGLYNTGVGVSLSVAVTITFLLALALVGGTLLERSHNRTREIERLAGENDKRLRAMLDNSKVAVHIKDCDGRIIFANQHFKEVFAVDNSELSGKSAGAIMPAKIAILHEFADQKVLATGSTHEFEEEIDCSSGRRTYLSSKFPMHNSNGAIYAVGCVSTDITERKHAEDEINKFFELSINLHCIANQEGYFVKLNSAWEDLLGFTREELTTKQFLDFVHSEDRELTLSQVKRLADGLSVVAFENRYQCRDGSYKTLLWSATPSFDNTLIYATASDITERKLADEKIAELNKALSHRAVALESANAELEAFSYSVSHDLRAPLRSIDGFSLALLEDFEGKLGTDGDDYLRRVRAATQRMSQLIDDMLQLSRVSRGDFNREEVDLSRLAQSIVNALREKHPERNVEFTQPLGIVVDGDPRLLQVALDNLIENAWKYTSKIERAQIEFGRTVVDGTEAYYIRDNGAGFDPSYAGKLFCAFQRLHSAGEFEGTGVGLATVRRIVNRHGGRTWAKGVVDRGATFYFTLGPAIVETTPTPAQSPTVPVG